MTRTLSAGPPHAARRWAIEGATGWTAARGSSSLPARRSWTCRGVAPPAAHRSRPQDGPARRAERRRDRRIARGPAPGRQRRDGAAAAADRRDELSQQRRQAVNRLHRHLRDLVPGGAPTSDADGAAQVLSRRPRDPVAIERKHVRAAAHRRDPPARKELRGGGGLGTTLTGVFGISYRPPRSSHRPDRTVRHCRTPSPATPAQPRSRSSGDAVETVGCRVRATGNSTPHCTWWPTCSACTQAPGTTTIAARSTETTTRQGHLPPAP